MTVIDLPRRPFKFVGGRLCLDFVNTKNWDDPDPAIERFRTYQDLVDWGLTAGQLTQSEATLLWQEAVDNPDKAVAAFAFVLHLREVIYRIFEAVAAGHPAPSDDIGELNSALVVAAPHRQIVVDEQDFGWHWQNTTAELGQMWWPVAWSAGELLTSDQLARVGECGGHSCGWLFFDTSRNGSRRWCQMQHCGNLAKARRHYRRKKEQI